MFSVIAACSGAPFWTVNLPGGVLCDFFLFAMGLLSGFHAFG